MVLPLLVEVVKDGINDSLDTGDIDEQDHRSGATPDLDEAALDGIGRAQLAPQRLGQFKERQQFGQFAFQPAHQGWIERPPVEAELSEGAASLGDVAGPVDTLGIAFHSGLVAAPHAVAQIAHLVHPAALMTRPWIDGFDRRS